MAKILLLNGPNLNSLGTRQPGLYGKRKLSDIEEHLQGQAAAAGVELDCLQSNAESDLIDWIQAASSQYQALIINPGALAHTSIALRDALEGAALPFIEVHITNLYNREAFRHCSYLSDIASGVILGLGTLGYELALTASLDILQTQREKNYGYT